MKSLIGRPAPAFSLPDQAGKEHSLAAYSGKWVLLYFYPKDMTPGCTIETKEFADRTEEYRQRGIQVLGISADSVESHAKFGEFCGANFPLLADTEKTVIRAYGVWKKKTIFGWKGYGISRDSFLIDPKGLVVKRYTRVKPKEHPQEVLNDVKALTE